MVRDRDKDGRGSDGENEDQMPTSSTLLQTCRIYCRLIPFADQVLISVTVLGIRNSMIKPLTSKLYQGSANTRETL